MRILKKELLVMWVAIAVIALMCLRPPRLFQWKPQPDFISRLEDYTLIQYAWLWLVTPEQTDQYYYCTGGKLEIPFLIVQCFVVALLAGGVIVTMRAKRSDA